MDYPRLATWWHLPLWALFEVFLYVVVVGVLTTALVGVVWLVAYLSNRLRIPRAFAAARYTSLLFIAAYLCGVPANLVFIAYFRYHAYIPGDPVVDWVPFVPSGSWVIDPNFRGHFINGGSPELLRQAWVVLAVPVWALALWLTNRPSRPSLGSP
jgi:hypothetical protein